MAAIELPPVNVNFIHISVCATALKQPRDSAPRFFLSPPSVPAGEAETAKLVPDIRQTRYFALVTAKDTVYTETLHIY